MIENNPYKKFFTQKQLDSLVKYVPMGQTADSEEMGLKSKFELEACNEFLLTGWGLVLLKVRLRETPSYFRVTSVLDGVYPRDFP